MTEGGAHNSVFEGTGSSDAVRVLVSTCPDGQAAVAEIVAGLGDPEAFGFLLLYVSPDYSPEDIASGLRRYAPDIPHAGCSTSGAIAFGRVVEHGLVAIGFAKASFEVACSPLFDLADFTIADGVELVTDLKAGIGTGDFTEKKNVFALTLFDGLSRREEQVLAALEHVLGTIDVVGGSSGDSLRLTGTFALRNGDVRRGAGVIVLMRTSLAFRSFKSDRFQPTGERFVVTACDPANRTILELNAEPAAEAYARALGVPPETLDHRVFSNHPLLVQVDGELFCRSIQTINADGSLVCYSAVETGVIFMLGKAGGIAESLRQSLTALEAEFTSIDLILGFECVQRKVEAETLGFMPGLHELYRKYRVAGFWTYGEQYHGLHLNYTFTGLAIGRQA